MYVFGSDAPAVTVAAAEGREQGSGDVERHGEPSRSVCRRMRV